MLIDGYPGQEHATPTAPLYKDVITAYAKSGIEYTPTLLNGVPVPVIMTVTVNFTLQ